MTCLLLKYILNITTTLFFTPRIRFETLIFQIIPFIKYLTGAMSHTLDVLCHRSKYNTALSTLISAAIQEYTRKVRNSYIISCLEVHNFYRVAAAEVCKFSIFEIGKIVAMQRIGVKDFEVVLHI